jgi:hypothetical protein
MSAKARQKALTVYSQEAFLRNFQNALEDLLS